MLRKLECLAAGLVLAMLLAGCATDEKSPFADLDPGGMPGSASGPPTQSPEIIKIGDVLLVSVADIPTPPQPFTVKVREDGTITLLLNQTFAAAGKTAGVVEKEAHARYVPRYFTQLTLSIMPANAGYFVNGEVKSPNRYAYAGPTTVLKAIASAGDFTDWANKRKVRLTRTDKTSHTVDCIKALGNPSLDLEVFPGDTIHVPRKVFF